jgi:hypothetical protein
MFASNNAYGSDRNIDNGFHAVSKVEGKPVSGFDNYRYTCMLYVNPK